MAISFLGKEDFLNEKEQENASSILLKCLVDHSQELLELNYIFVSDVQLLKMNKEFLNHDYFTDIISFDLTEDGEGLCGECYISYERVEENARNHGESLIKEKVRVLVHGLLHFLGYNDKEVDEKAIMREAEEKYILSFCSTWNSENG